MKGIYFTIGLIGKSSLLPLCVMAPGCYACVYGIQHRPRGLGIGEWPVAAETLTQTHKHNLPPCIIQCLWSGMIVWIIQDVRISEGQIIRAILYLYATLPIPLLISRHRLRINMYHTFWMQIEHFMRNKNV